jgi:hypothetical protein
MRVWSVVWLAACTNLGTQAQLPPPNSLSLAGPTAVLETLTETWTVSGGDLSTGDTVFLAWGGSLGSGPCPFQAQTGGLCMDITNPARRIATATAFADPANPGQAIAVFDVQVPPGNRSTIHLQAMSLGSSPSTSNTLTVGVSEAPPPADRPDLSLPPELSYPGETGFDDAVDLLNHAQLDLDWVYTRLELARAKPGTCDGSTAAIRDGVGYATLQDAVAANAQDGFILLCDDFVHAETVNVPNGPAPFTVFAPHEAGTRPVWDGQGTHGLIDGASGAHVGVVSLEMRNADSAAAIRTSSASLFVSDVHFIDNGSLSSGSGALDVSSGRSTWIVDSTFSGNEASSRGGAGEIFSQDLVVSGCTFTDNEADYEGGALYFNHGVFSSPGGLGVFAENTFTGNRSGYGGGTLLLGNRYIALDAVLIGNEIRSSHSDYEGGAVGFSPAGGEVSIYADVYATNSSDNSGAGIDYYGWGAGVLDLIDVEISGSTTARTAIELEGTGGTFNMTGGKVENNVTTAAAVRWSNNWTANGSNVSFAGNAVGDIEGCPPGTTGNFADTPGSGVVICP